MPRALVWKEWRQLRALRFAGLALGLVLPFAFLAGASAARHGLGPLSRVGGDATRTILLEVLPATLALAVWPFAALLVAAQAFAGDRAAGVESFLLERPVSRARIWWARLTASIGSILIIATGTGLVWAFFSWMSASPAATDWSSAAGILAAGGILTGLAFVGTVAAAAAVAAPLAAALLGLLLATLPAGLAFVLVSRFPLAAYRAVPLGAVLPWILVLAFFVASYFAFCRGEPAGRGRMFRWGVILGLTVTVVIASFFALAPLLIRVGAVRLERGASVAPSRTASAALVTSVAGPSVTNPWGTNGSWIMDVGTGETRAFLPPPVLGETAWSEDGKTLAVVTGSAPFGGVTTDPRVEFLDVRGRPVGKSVRVPNAGWWEGIRWAGGRLVLRTSRGREIGVVVLDPTTGEVRDPDLWRSWWNLALLRPTDDGRMFIAVGPQETPRSAPNNSSEAQRRVDYAVHRFDVERGWIDPEPILRETGRPWASTERLSPSGRYWLVDRAADRCDTRPLLDLATGTEVPPQIRRGPVVWLAGDALAWLESDGASTWLLLGRPGEGATPLRGWSGLDVSLEVSPERKLLLVRATARPKDRASDSWKCGALRTPALHGLVPDGKGPEARVYEVASGRWMDLPRWAPEERPDGRCVRAWAGPRTLARTGPGFFALEDLDRPGIVRNVIGRAPAQ